MRRARRGSSLIDLLVGTALGLGVLSLLTAAVAGGGRLLGAAGARGEAEDTAQLVTEALAFDVRRAGFDPTAAGVAAVVEARADRLVLAADLDGDGSVDPESQETTAYVCAPASRRLSRIIGRQSMPLADGVLRCALGYLDAGGAPLPPPADGLDAAARARVRAVTLDLALAPTALASATARTVTVALRTRP